jgi:hypothetical protein
MATLDGPHVQEDPRLALRPYSSFYETLRKIGLAAAASGTPRGPACDRRGKLAMTAVTPLAVRLLGIRGPTARPRPLFSGAAPPTACAPEFG